MIDGQIFWISIHHLWDNKEIDEILGEYIVNNLITEVDKLFRTNKEFSIGGSSMGGLFISITHLTQEELSEYIRVSSHAVSR